MDRATAKKIKDSAKFISEHAEVISPEYTSEVDDYTLSQAGFGPNFDGSTIWPNSSVRGDFNARGSELEIRKKIAACREAYRAEGIIGNIVDIMVDFSVEEVEITHESPQIQSFYKVWKDTVNLEGVLSSVLKGYYRDGNVPVLKIFGQLSERAEKKLKRAFSNEFLISPETAPKSIPIKYSVLDMLRFRKEGSELLGIERFWYEITADDIRIITNPQSDFEEERVRKIKESMSEEQFKELTEQSLVMMDPEKIAMLYYKKDSFSKWAVPMLWRVIPDVKFKALLRRMDISVAEGVLNTLTIVRLGNIEEGLPPSADQYSKMATMLKNPAKSKIIVWDNLIDIISDYPPVEKILGKEKYEQVNEDIRSGAGVPSVLIDGQSAGGGFSNIFLAVKTLVERLQSGRQDLLNFLNNEVKMIARNMGFRKPPTVRMQGVNLKDEQAERKLLLELADRNVISYETLASRFGENIQVEINRMRKEDEMRKELKQKTPFVILKTGKFGPQHTQGILPIFADPKIDVPDDFPSGQEADGESGGKVPGPTGPQETQQSPDSPQGQSVSRITLDEDDYRSAGQVFDVAFEIITIEVMKSRGYSNISEITTSEANRIYKGIIKVMSNIQNVKDVNRDNIFKVLGGEYDKATAPPKLDRCVREVVKKEVSKFRKRNKRAPNKKEMKTITSKAFAVCNAALKKGKSKEVSE